MISQWEQLWSQNSSFKIDLIGNFLTKPLCLPCLFWNRYKKLPRRMRKLKRRLLLQRQRDFPMAWEQLWSLNSSFKIDLIGNFLTKPLCLPCPFWNRYKKLPRRMRKLKRMLLLQRQRDFAMGAAVVFACFIDHACSEIGSRRTQEG